MRRKLIMTVILAVSLTFTMTPKVFANTSFQSEDNIKIEETIGINDKIKEKANILCNNYGACSVQYAISEGDNIVISDNAGVYSKNEDCILTNNNMYGIASVSKMYVTTAVMQLVDEGKVDLDMPLTNYIKEFKMADERYKKITPRMLLNHSSGLMGTTDRGTMLFNDNDTFSHDNLLKELEEQKLKADPGEYSVYCNDGFSLAEILVERVSGLSYTDYIKIHFSQILGLQHTKTPLDVFDRNLLAKAYSLSKDYEDPVENVNSIGAGGLYSTAEDMCKFANAITRKDGKGILSEKSMNDMANEEYLKGIWITDAEDNLMSYGLGWDSVNLFPFNRYGIKALYKGGDTLCYHSAIIALPQFNITMSVVSSGSSSTLNMLFASQSLLEYLKENNYIDEIKEDVNWQEERSQSMPKYLKKYEGIYNTKDELIDVKISDDGILTINSPSSKEPSTYYHTYSGYFMKEGGNNGIRFTTEKNGVTYIEEKKYETLDELGQGALDLYFGEKVEENNITDEVRKAWDKHQSSPFLPLNEKYSSIIYILGRGINPYLISSESHGFIAGNKIINSNIAEPCVRIPMNNGRDLNKIEFSTENGINYVKIGSLRGICEESVPMFKADMKDLQIDKDGYTKWFKVSEDLNGKNITVDSSKNTSFIVYDESGNCKMDSYINGNKSLTLAKGDYIGFAGDIGEKFGISIN